MKSATGASRKEWRVVSENSSLRNSSHEGQEGLDAVVDFCSIQMDGIMGVDDGIVQQKIHTLSRQREELQQMEIELRAQIIAKSEIIEMQNSFDARLKDQANVTARLQEQLREREQEMHELERKMEEKERELHAVRLDNEAAWAKEDLLREQNKELANFRRERDSIEAERAHHIKQIHDLQEHLQDKERQLLELQEQHRVAQETILYKDEQIREAQAWMARVQEMDVLQSTNLQAELRERTDQYNQLWLGCQRQRWRGCTCRQFNSFSLSCLVQEERVEPLTMNQVSHRMLQVMDLKLDQTVEVMLKLMEVVHQVIVLGFFQTELQKILRHLFPLEMLLHSHVPSLPITPPSMFGVPSYLQPGQVTALHPYVMHQPGTNNSVPSHVPQSHLGQFHSVPAMASFQQWHNQQAVSESAPRSSQNQYSLPQNEENPSRPESNYSYELSVNGPSLHPDYLNAHTSQGLVRCELPSLDESEALVRIREMLTGDPETHHSLQQISSQFHEALRLEPLNETSEIKENDAMNAVDNGPEHQDVTVEQTSSAASPSPSEASVHPAHFAEATVNSTTDAVLSESFVSAGQTNSLSSGKVPEPALFDERALLACIVRTIPAGGKIRISSTLPNRLGKMLAPLHWHDYKKKYGKLDEFVSSHPELFVIEEDYIQLREGAQGIIAATAAVAKVAAAAAASSPYSNFFPSVAVTPMAHAGRVRKIPSLESKPVRNPADCTHPSATQNHHSNGASFSASGVLSNVKILSKSKDQLEHNNSEIRPGQTLLVPAENGAHSDRSVLGNPQSKGPIHARAAVGYVGRQQSRTSSAQMASRR